jgi:hypothetical protein
MKISARTAVLVLFFTAAAGLAEVVVLKGGAVVTLQRPPVRRGNTALLTRMDGTLVSVSASEIDRAATATANSAPPPAAPASAVPARPATLAEAARASREVPKARVRITDANVSHGESSEEPAAAEAADAAKESSAGSGRVEVADYAQEKSGDALVVRGTLRNPGSTPAMNVRMTVTALDPKGQTIAAGEAGISSGTIEPTRTAAFSVTIPVGARAVVSIKFAPRWVSPTPPAEPASEDPAVRGRAPGTATGPASATAPPPAARPNEPPPPEPTPYGRGSLYAPPAPNAPSEAPKDGKTGYLPGASHPGNQPKPPS